MKKINESKNSKKFNATINKVHEEMIHVEKVASSWNAKWRETLSKAYCYDLQYLTEDEIAWLESINENRYDLTDGADNSKRIGAALRRETLSDENGEIYECEFRNIEWLITSSKIGRIFNFDSSGKIKYSQIKRNRKETDDSHDYFTGYNVNDNSLAIRFTKTNEDIAFLAEGDSRAISTDGIVISEDSNGLEITEEKDIDHRLVIRFNGLGKMESKEMIYYADTYEFYGNELVRATRRIDDDVIELSLDDEWIKKIFEELTSYQIGLLHKKEVLTIIENAKTRVINGIKAIINDVTLKGLSERLYIALSMISNKQVLKDPPLKKEKKPNK